jgi:hypothetical protein
MDNFTFILENKEKKERNKKKLTNDRNERREEMKTGELRRLVVVDYPLVTVLAHTYGRETFMLMGQTCVIFPASARMNNTEGKRLCKSGSGYTVIILCTTLSALPLKKTVYNLHPEPDSIIHML